MLRGLGPCSTTALRFKQGFSRSRRFADRELQAGPDLPGELSGFMWVAAVEHELWGCILGWGGWHFSEHTALHLMGGWIWWMHKSNYEHIDSWSTCLQTTQLLLSSMSSLDMVDNILPDVLGTQTPYRTALNGAWSSAFLFVVKAVESLVLKATLGQPSHHGANIYPKSWFASHLGAFILPCSPLPLWFFLRTLFPDGAVGSSLPREDEETLAFKYESWA